MIQGSLFTRDFLTEGIRRQAAWDQFDGTELNRLKRVTVQLFDNIRSTKNPNEAVTEKDLIYPLLAAIGWGDLVLVQQSASKKGRSDIPDGLLFADEAALSRGKQETDSWQRFRHGVCLVESKKWARVLDREEKGAKPDEGVPSTQMLRYLRRQTTSPAASCAGES